MKTIISLVMDPNIEDKPVYYIQDNKGRYYNSGLKPTRSQSRRCIYIDQEDAYFAWSCLNRDMKEGEDD